MRVQFLFAPALLDSPYEVLAENMWAPLGILYLASYVREKIPGLTLKVTDGCRMGYARAMEEIEAFKPDILAISFYTTQAHGAFRISAETKQKHPGCLVVLGGTHASALPAETLKESGADLVVAGEGEHVFHDIVKERADKGAAADYGAMPGVWMYDKSNPGNIIKNEPAKFVTPLDSLPFPAFDLVDLHSYRGWYLSRQRPESTIFSARGCVYACVYCSNCVWKSSSPKLRLRTPKNVVDEIEYLQKTFGVKEFFDQADEFNNNLENAIAICKELKARNLGITWKAQLRVKPFNEELAKAMAEAGCWYVHLGIETGNQETIDGIKKKIRLEDVRETCRLLRKYNIKILGLFMLYNVWEDDQGNLKWETSEMSEKTLDFAANLVREGLLNYISWSITTPYPGSKLFDIAVRHKILKKEYLEKWESWLKEELFLMEIPGITATDFRRVKIKGEWLRFRCLLKNMDFKPKDVWFMGKRLLHIILKAFTSKKK